jgi:hypothetical protein
MEVSKYTDEGETVGFKCCNIINAYYWAFTCNKLLQTPIPDWNWNWHIIVNDTIGIVVFHVSLWFWNQKIENIYFLISMKYARKKALIKGISYNLKIAPL